MSEPILQLRGVSRDYVTGDKVLQVLKGVDLDVYPGQMVGLIGPSGSGKSSMLHAAGLLERPTSGEVFLLGNNCSELKDAARSRVRLQSLGFVYQFHHLLAELSALDNVALPQMIAGQSRAVARARAAGKLARRENVAAVIATHNMDLARHMDRVFALRDGHLVEQKPG